MARVTRDFCAYFDSAFLFRGLALYHSLKRHCPGARLWLLCLDEACHRTLSGLELEGVRLLRLSDLERRDPELMKVKKSRTPLEYALTCTPILPLHVLETCPDVEVVTYLDADLYFFSDPEPLFAEMGSASIAITPHKYLPAFKKWEGYCGIYNDGWVAFRRDSRTLDCLRRWRGQCLEWCANRSENGRFTEQQYLDDWPRLFGAAVLRHPGANVGPWNLGGVRVSRTDGRVLVDGEPLVFFHFSGLKRVAGRLYDLNLADFRVRSSRAALDGIFAPYLREIDRLSERFPDLAEQAMITAGRKEEQLPPPPMTLRLRRAAEGLANGYWAFFLNGRLLTPPRPSRRLRVVTAVTLTLVLFELFVRSPMAPASLRRLFVGFKMQREHVLSDSELGYRLRASYRLIVKGSGLNLEFTHKSLPHEALWGYRSNGPGAKPDGGADFVALGDSFTYGLFVSDRDTWVSRLGALTGLSAVNLGVAGYGTSQEAQLYRRNGRSFRPRAVLIQLCPNDLWENLLYRDWRADEASKGLDFGVYMRRRMPTSPVWTSRVARFVVRRSLPADYLLRRWISRQVALRLKREPEEVARGMRMLLEDLAGLNEEISTQGRVFAVVIGDDWARSSPVKRAELRAFLASKHIPFLDLGDTTLWRYAGRELRVWGDSHWNERGHAVVAAEVYRFLRREGLLSRAGRRP